MKVVSPEDAVSLIKDNMTVVTEGFNRTVHPEVLSRALEDRFLNSGSPKNLTLVYSGGMGELPVTDGHGWAVNHYAKEGLLKKVICGHLALAPDLGKLVFSNKIEAYNIPQGTIAHMFRDSAARKAGTITRVGLGTFVDPRQEGCRLNAVSTAPVNEVVVLAGEENLFYPRIDFDFCMLRGTYADEKGNISMERECLVVDNLAVAQAVHRNGGTVVVQVSKVVRAGSLNPHNVIIPSILVDYVVVVPEPQNMWELPQADIDVFCGQVRVPDEAAVPQAVSPLNERKVIARRAAFELAKGAAVNLGTGMPELVATIAAEEGVFNDFSLTVEAGAVGGLPQPRPMFGSSINVECIVTQSQQFDFYDGGGLDLAFLGLAETDPIGNINVSKMGTKIPGAGGFINIASNARKLFFCGTFTGKGLKVAIRDGQVVIEQEGSIRKFLNKIEQITYSGKMAMEQGQTVLFITERAVFELKSDGIHLIEVAPGISVEKDILAHMDFAPIIDGAPRVMDARIFQPGLMNLTL